jgi:phenylalanine ammonia-lyase
VQVDGYTLTLGDVVAVARNGRACEMSADGRIKERIDQSVAFLKSKVSPHPLLPVPH